MKYTAVFCGLLIALMFAGSANAQVSRLRVTFSEAIDATGTVTANYTFTGLENPSMQLFEGSIRVPAERCFESTKVSNVRPVSPDRASIDYDASTGTYLGKWIVGRDEAAPCLVLFGSSNGRVDAADYVVWRKNSGTQLHEGDVLLGKTADGASAASRIFYRMVVDHRPR